MAGRGTDIQLGGNVEMRVEHELGGMPKGAERRPRRREAAIRAEVARFKERALEAGGLYVLGTERHEAGASTTSCAAAPAARATPAARSSSCRCRTT